MENQLLLDNFLETVLEPDKETINYYGVEVPLPSPAQAELNYQFNLNLKNKVLPSEFEKVIEKVKVKIKLDLKRKYELYLFIIYNICYLKNNKVDVMKNSIINFKELNKLLFDTEENITKYYEHIKRLSLN